VASRTSTDIRSDILDYAEPSDDFIKMIDLLDELEEAAYIRGWNAIIEDLERYTARNKLNGK